MRQIIDKHYDNDEFKFEFAEGSNATLLVDVQSLGSADTNLSGYTAKLYYYDSVRDTSSYQITSDSLDAATGRFTFDIQPSDLAEYGAYLAELVIIDGSDNEFVQCFGNVIIKESILDAGTTAATTGPVLNYTVFSSFSGTKTSGPYTAGTNITFSDPDSDGRVAINSSGGGGGGDVTAAANIADNALVRGDGGAKGIQESGITVDDSDNVSGIGNITLTGTVDGRDIATDGTKLDGIASGAEVNSLPFGTWDYDSDLGTPDAGQFSTNNATASSVTLIKIHDNNSAGVDVSGITDLFNAGDYLYIQESGDASTSHLYLIDSRGLSFTGGQSFNVTHQSLSSNSTWTNGNACGIFYIHASETNDYLLDRANHTGTQTASTISDFDTEVSNNTDVTANTAKVSADGSVTTHNDVTDAGSGAIITSDERTKLSGIEAGAEVNPTDAEIETAYNNQVDVMSEAEAHAGTSNDVRRLTAHLVRHNIDSSQAAITAITLTIDGGGSAITAGALGKFPTVPYSGEIESVEVAADQSGSIVIDIWKAADAIPTDTNSITGSSPATLSTAQRSQDETLTGWTTSISAGDVLGFEVDSVSTVQEVTLTIKVKKGS